MISRVVIIAIIAAAALSPARRADAQAQYEVIHTFAGPDGFSPWQMIRASDGNLYGVTLGGGAVNQGTVFRITPDGTFALVHSFNSASDGCSFPRSLVLAVDGNFYGVADRNHSIFKMTPSGTVTVLYTFASTEFPNHLWQSLDGNLYGDASISFGAATNVGGGFVFRFTLTGTRLSDLFSCGVDNDFCCGGVGPGVR